MFRYKNLPHAFSYQIIWCLIWAILIFLYGYKGFIFMIFGALRPLVLKMEPISMEEKPWKMNYLILLYTVITISCLIIAFYIIDVFLLSNEFVVVNKPKILLTLVPAFILIHGIYGLIYLYVNAKYS